MLKFLKRAGKYKWLLLVILVTIAINAYMECLIPSQLGQVIAHLQSSEQITVIAIDVLWLLLYAAVAGVAALTTCKIASVLTAHIVSVSRYELFKQVSMFSTREMNDYSVSSLVTRTTNDLTFVADTLNLLFRYIIYGPLLAIFALIQLMVEQIWALTIAVGIALALMIISIVIIIVVVLPKYEAIQAKLDKVSLVTRENLEGLRVVRAYHAEDYQEKKFGVVNTILMKTERFSNRGMGLLMPLMQLIIGLLNVAIYAIGAVIMNQEGSTFTYSKISVVIQFAALILVGFVMVIAVVIQLPRCIVCMKRVNVVIDTKPSVVGKETSPATNEVGTIEFKNVSFAYPGAEEPVLKNISFSVKKGETIAFIGATGSGKSTLINLMPRFFDCTEGQILIDGVDVKEYNLEDLNAKFGYVPQRGYLFHDSLVNNITIGKPNANPTQIERALAIAQASEFVSKLPDGLNYEISQGGKNVSGGQRQRLCIARAIIMEPEIFIFDDSFSALDYRTDKVLRGEIKKQCVGTTNVIVAQRVGTIMDADKIIVLEKGEAVGMGTHKELLKTCAVYKEIALSQLSKEELENDKD